MTKCNKCGYDYSGSGDSAHPCMPVNVQQRTWVGLTDEEITALKHNGERYISSQDFARAVEAKLKQKNGFAEEKNA